MSRRPRRVGIFGGTFDPPHVGHLSVVHDVAEALDLDEVTWIPAGRSPHKPDAPLTAGKTRSVMVRCAVSADSRFSVDESELVRDGLSYTVDTLERLESRRPGTDFFLIIGRDQYEAFDRWKAPDRIRSLATVVVMDRDGQGGATAPDVAVPVGRVDVSATEVRRRVRGGERIRGLVPECVAAAIAEYRLYTS